MFGILFREGMLVLSRKYCPPENISTQKIVASLKAQLYGWLFSKCQFKKRGSDK